MAKSTTPARKKVPATFTDKPLHKFTKTDFRRNARLLADKLQTIPNSKHNQRHWGYTDHACKTVGCALGIAAMSHIIPGLQFQNYISPRGATISPIVNGKERSYWDWDDVGVQFFGRPVTNEVFMNTCLSKQEVIDRLRRYDNTGRL